MAISSEEAKTIFSKLDTMNETMTGIRVSISSMEATQRQHVDLLSDHGQRLGTIERSGWKVVAAVGGSMLAAVGSALSWIRN